MTNEFKVGQINYYTSYKSDDHVYHKEHGHGSVITVLSIGYDVIVHFEDNTAKVVKMKELTYVDIGETL